MEFVNYFYSKSLTRESKHQFVQLLSPFAPHICEEMWSLLGNKDSVFKSNWPIFDSQKIIKSSMQIAIQVNGKMRGTIDVDADETKDEIIRLSKNNTNVNSFIENKQILREIYVPGKLVNFVIK